MKPRTAWLILGIGFIALTVYLSLNTKPIETGEVGGVKVGHFIAYGWLGLWFSQLRPNVGGRTVLLVYLAAMGVTLEYLQRMTGYRSFAYSDMVDNALGAAIGIALAFSPLGRVLELVEKRWNATRESAAGAKQIGPPPTRG